MSSVSTAKDCVDAALFDKEQFKSSIRLVALRVPAKACSEYLKRFGDQHLFCRPKTKKIYNVEGDPSSRYVLLNESIRDTALSELPEELRDFNARCGGVPVEYSFDVDYTHYAADEALQKLLPSLAEIPSSFEQAGHIAHLNLREEVLPYKYIIGAVLLDKAPSIRTVVNKISSIATEYRTFPMELIAGDDDYEVTLRESGATFRFNFCDVYWNSRLQMEHDRLISIIRNKACAVDGKEATSTPLIVADMMAGVGPFAVPLAMPPPVKKDKRATKEQSSVASNSYAQRAIVVHANDLNPSSFKYLTINAKANKCGERLSSYNQDGREFILQLLEKGVSFEHVIMNLPQTAIEFLDVFVGSIQRLGAKYEGHLWQRQLPRIHVYSFSTHPTDPIADVVQRAAEVMRTTAAIMLSDGAVEGHIVRDVAPKKVMVCLSFTLPRTVAQDVLIAWTQVGIKRSAGAPADAEESNEIVKVGKHS